MRVRMKHWPTLTVSMSGTSTLLWLSLKVCQQTGRSCSAFLIKSRDTHNWPCCRKKFQNLLFTLISLIFSFHVFESRDQILVLFIFWAIVIRLSQIIFFPSSSRTVHYLCLFFVCIILEKFSRVMKHQECTELCGHLIYFAFNTTSM